MSEVGTNNLGMELPWDLTIPTKAAVLKFLLMDCASWVNSSDEGLGELPTVRFHVQAGDETHELQLSGADYIFETSDLEGESEESGETSGWFSQARAVARAASVLQQEPEQ